MVASLFLSLDGVMEAPETWHFPYFDEAMEAAIGGVSSSDVPPRPEDVRGVGGVLARPVARRESDGGADQRRAQVRGLEDARRRRVGELDAARARPRRRVTSLKAPGKDIAVSGSATLVRSLFAEGLLDELGLMIHPIVLGRGVRLFEDRTPHAPLELVSSEAYGTGVLNLTYRPA